MLTNVTKIEVNKFSRTKVANHFVLVKNKYISHFINVQGHINDSNNFSFENAASIKRSHSRSEAMP